MTNVNIFNKDLRNIVRKELKTVPGGWIDFYDDITAGEIKKAQEAQKTGDISSSFEMVLSQIADWNFADNTEAILPITVESFDKLPIKIIKEIAELQAEILSSLSDKKKESPAS